MLLNKSLSDFWQLIFIAFKSYFYSTMKRIGFIFLTIVLLSSCKTDDTIITAETVNEDATPINPTTYKILSLGDSYTIGQSVCETCRFPVQLKDSLTLSFPNEDIFILDIIAQTGWTTSNLLDAIANENPENDYDLVTLLIGVNNQFQGRVFSLYQEEFPKLIDKAMAFTNGDKNNVIVVSIPDYAYTPFGQSYGNPETISEEIDIYNDFAKDYCSTNNITFVNITDITRDGLNNTDLVASDQLHPSELAYTKFVERILPLALRKIE